MHKVFAETLATKFREVRSCRDEDGSVASGGPSVSTTLKSLAIPLGAEWLSLTPRNFAGGAGVMRYALAPRLTIIITNEYRRDPYTQAKAQLSNLYRGDLEHVERDCDRMEDPVKEEAIQIGAKEIDSQNRHPGPSMEQKQVAQMRKQAKARKKAAKEV